MMKWKFQYSLSSLLWFTLCFALLLTSILMYRRMIIAEEQMAKAEADAAVMRRAAGYLLIGDKKLVHGFFVDTHERYAWKWRLFLPDAHHYAVKIASGDMLFQGKPRGEPVENPIDASGEITISVDIHRDKDNTWCMYFSFKNEKLDLEKGTYPSGPWTGYSRPIPISSSMMEQFEKCLGYQSNIFGGNGTETAKPNDTIVLLRNRLLKKQSTGAETISEEPMSGIMIWLEEKK